MKDKVQMLEYIVKRTLTALEQISLGIPEDPREYANKVIDDVYDKVVGDVPIPKIDFRNDDDRDNKSTQN